MKQGMEHAGAQQRSVVALSASRWLVQPLLRVLLLQIHQCLGWRASKGDGGLAAPQGSSIQEWLVCRVCSEEMLTQFKARGKETCAVHTSW